MNRVTQPVRFFLAMIMALTLTTSPVCASQLRAFETSATRRSAKTTTGSGNILVEMVGSFIGLVMSALITGMIEDPGDLSYDEFRFRSASDEPFFRAELLCQRAGSDIRGMDGRVEAGRGPWMLRVRHTQYKEQKPIERLALTGIHGVGRLVERNGFEMRLGLGASFLDGERHADGFSITCPMNWYPHPRMDVRMAPTLSWLGGNPVTDFDVSIGYAFEVLSLRSGYRWLRTGEASIHGPYLGLGIVL